MFDKEPRIVVKFGYMWNTIQFTYSGNGEVVTVPENFQSDGATLNGFTKLFFSTREFLLGSEAAVVHDYMTKNKSEFDRRASSVILKEIWVEAGLNPIKGEILCLFTDLYQCLLYRNEWKS